MSDPAANVILNTRSPFQSVMSHDGSKIWSFTDDNTMDCLNTADQTIISTVTAGNQSIGFINGHAELVLSANGNYIYAANWNSAGDKGLFRYNTTTTVTDSFLIDIYIVSLVASPTNSNILWAAAADQNLYKIDVTDFANTVVTTYSVSNIDSGRVIIKILISPNGNNLYFCNGSNDGNIPFNLYRYSIASGSPVYSTSYPVISLPQNLCISSDGLYLYVVSRSSSSIIQRINTSTGVIKNIPFGNVMSCLFLLGNTLPGTFGGIASATIYSYPLCISSDNNYIWAVLSSSIQNNINNSALLQLDTTTFEVAISPISFTQTYSLLANKSMTSPAYVWLTQENPGSIVQYSVPMTNEFTYSLPSPVLSGANIDVANICISPDGQYGWIVDVSGNIIRITLSTLSSTTIGTINGEPLSASAGRASLTHNGLHFVFISSDVYITIVNTSTLNIVKPTAALSFPGGGAYQRNLVADINNNHLFWIMTMRLNGGTTLVSININNVNSNSDNPVITDFTSTMDTYWATDDNGFVMTISPDGDNLYMYIGEGTNFGKIYNWVITSGSPVIGSTPSYFIDIPTDTIVSMAVSTDGLYLYYTALNAGVNKITLSTGVITPLYTYPSGISPRSILLSSDETYLWVSIYNSALYVSAIIQINISTLQVIYGQYIANGITAPPSFTIPHSPNTSPGYLWLLDSAEGPPILTKYPVPLTQNYYTINIGNTGGTGDTGSTGNTGNTGNTGSTGNTGNTGIPCFCPGTRILTTTGYKAVEDLTKDDLAVTPDGRHVNINIYKNFIQQTTTGSAPYCIPAGSFGKTMPLNDLCLSPIHTFLDENGIWQCAKYIEKEGLVVKQFGVGEPMIYYHIECPNYFTDNIIVEGMVAESFKNRQGPNGVMYTWSNKINGFIRNNIDEITPPDILDTGLKLCAYY